MECGRRGYTKSSAIYEVQLSKDDSYHSVIRKISRSIGIDDCEENELRLFNGRGGIILVSPRPLPRRRAEGSGDTV